MALRLLGKSSSINVRKVLWTCAEIGLAPEREDWGAGFRDTRDPAFLRLNPNALVPVLIDGEGPQALVLRESNTICRYLAAKHGREDLLPAEPGARALIELWMDWQATELNNAWRYVFMGRVRQSPSHQDPALLATGASEWNRHMAILDAQLERSGAHVAGEDFTLADIVLGLSVNRWLMTPFDKPELPAVAAYYDRLSLRPAFLAHGRNGTP